jgi:DNA polymerase-3 subunit delta'
MIIGHKSTFEDLKGLQKTGRLGHGYIFFGPSMTGKRTLALAFAKFLEKSEFDAPGENEVLQDLKVIDVAFMKSLDPEASGETIGINAVREIKNFLWQRPNVSSRRTLIIDNADILTTEAQNALLKITEEPPGSSLLLLLTSDIDAILPTIVSRLPKMYIGTVAEKKIAAWLTEEQGITKTNAAAAAKRALGKPGLAWRLAHDEAFRADLDLAEAFLKTPATARKEFIKKLIEPDDFRMRRFLDALVTVLAWQEPSAAKAAFWHKTLRLYENASDFTLNPRLQLEALMR